MPWITAVVPYNAVLEKVERLALFRILDEVGQILTGFSLTVLEERNKNGGKAVREMLDICFLERGWIPEEEGMGDIDWIKRIAIDGVTIAVGVELQVSGRGGGSHLSDIIHLRAGLTEAGDGRIDIGLLVVPTDRLAVYLTDRVEGITKVKGYLKSMKAEDLPLLVLALEHDGPGPALPKQQKRSGAEPKRLAAEDEEPYRPGSN